MQSFLSTVLAGALKKLLTEVVEWITAFFARKKEQKERHQETDGKVEDFKKAKDVQSAKDTFDRLP